MLSRVFLAFKKFSDDGLFTDAAAVAFYTVLSAGPLLVLLMTFLSQFDPALIEMLAKNISNSFGVEGTQILIRASQETKNRIDLSSISGWIGGFTLLISSSLLFTQLQKSFNKVFRTVELKSRKWYELVTQFFIEKILSVSLVFLSIILALISLVLSTTMNIWLPERQMALSTFIDFSVNFFVFTLLFWFVFRWTPDDRIDTKKSLFGAMITCILFLIGKSAIGFYLKTAAISSIYGAAGSLLIILLWVYYSSAVIFIGAELASVWLLRTNTEG